MWCWRKALSLSRREGEFLRRVGEKIMLIGYFVKGDVIYCNWSRVTPFTLVHHPDQGNERGVVMEGEDSGRSTRMGLKSEAGMW